MPRSRNEPQTLEIRKYQNRRYYDTTRSRHLGLQEIHRLIIDGYDIRVIDTQTNEDITSKILTQILLEYDSVKLNIFSNELLIRAIRANDNLLKDFVDLYFRQAFEVFCTSQKQFEQMLREAHNLTSAMATPSAWIQSMIPPWMRYRSMPGTTEPSSAGSEASATPDVMEELAALRRDLAALQAQLKKSGISTRSSSGE